MLSERSSGTGPRFVLLAVVVLLVGAGVATGLLAADAGGPEGEELLQRSAERYDRAETVASTVAVTTTTTNGTNTSSVTVRADVQYAAPDDHRVEIRSPERVNGTVVATNGTVAWIGGPNGSVVVRPVNESLRPVLVPDHGAAVANLTDNASVTNNGTTTVDGEEVYEVDVRPENGTTVELGPYNFSRVGSTLDERANDSRWNDTRWNHSRATANEARENLTARLANATNVTATVDVRTTVWIDAEDYQVRKVRTVLSTGNWTVTRVVEYERVRFNVSIHESTFRPPDRVDVIGVGSFERTSYEEFAAAQANTSIDLSEPSPPGDFELTGIVVAGEGDAETAVFAYDNGSANLSVIQSARNRSGYAGATDGEPVTVDGHEATYVRRDGTGIVYWTTEVGTVESYAVVGDLPKERLLSAAESA